MKVSQQLRCALDGCLVKRMLGIDVPASQATLLRLHGPARIDAAVVWDSRPHELLA